MTDKPTTILCLASLFAIFHIASVAAEHTAPFVSGFERFGRHDEVDQALAGEVLLSELSCTACHASERIAAKAGPQLNSIARRVNEKWLRDYLAAPANVKPGTTMPDVLSGATKQSKQEAILALAAFLSTLQADYPTIKAGGANPVEFEFWKKGDLERGAKLYHQVGCIACHAAGTDYEVAEQAASPLDELLEELDPDELAEMGLASASRRVPSVPHGDLAAKYSRRSLTRFLHDPVHFRPGGRMPNMKLTPDEAADITAYLLQRRDPSPDLGPAAPQAAKTPASSLPGPEHLASMATVIPDDSVMPAATDGALIENGRQLFATLGCANCHQAEEIPSQRFTPLEELDLTADTASCLVEASGGATYALDSDQTAAIRAAIRRLKSPSQDTGSEPKPSDLVQRTLLQMNCYACHTRDELGGVGRYRKGYFETVRRVDLGDEGRLPPPLSGVGRKLKPAWLKRVFRGDPKTTLRPHMTIRMPAFPHADVTALADQLGVVDGANPAPASEVFASSAAETGVKPDGNSGRSLMEIGCIECHEFASEAMPGVIGVDLVGVPERVFPSWFRDFVMNPGQVKNRTRMPNFFPEGKSQVPQVLGGDAAKQIAAMWDYLEHAKRYGIPGKIAAQRAKNYELTPTDHPLMLRTFMKGVGMHAIAVGFPAGVHFAVDAQQARLAMGWRKKFVDARSTWFERFTPLVDPLDPHAQSIDAGPSFFKTDAVEGLPVPVRIEFLGYQLDHDRVPTFRYRGGGYLIEDRIVPAERGGLRRLIRLRPDEKNDAEELLFRVIQGDQVTQETEHQFRSESGLSVRLLKSNPPSAGPAQWMVPLSAREDLELIYQW